MAMDPCTPAELEGDALGTGSGGVKSTPSMRKNGKNWHAPRAAFRPTKSLTSYAKQRAASQALAATKAKEAEMRAEKKDARDQANAAIREKRERKEERKRWEMLEAKLGAKRAERKRRREKRNKMLKS